MRQIEGQMDIFQFLDKPNPTKPIPMPEWGDYKEMVQNCKGLDEVMDKLPKYLVTFKKPVWRLPYPIKKEICVYVGEWHSISGWSYSKTDELLNIESWEPIEYKKGDQYSWNNTDYPYRFQCMTNCDVEYCSLICFERRGAMFDRVERKFLRNEDGTLMCSGHRSCAKGVDGMNYLKERSNT